MLIKANLLFRLPHLFIKLRNVTIIQFIKRSLTRLLNNQPCLQTAKLRSDFRSTAYFLGLNKRKQTMGIERAAIRVKVEKDDK